MIVYKSKEVFFGYISRLLFVIMLFVLDTNLTILFEEILH